MKKRIHHMCLFNHQGHTMIFEKTLPERLFVRDLLLLLSKDLLSGGVTDEIVTNLEVFIDKEKVLSLALFSPRHQSTGSAGAVRR